jgi:hypothetical protein
MGSSLPGLLLLSSSPSSDASHPHIREGTSVIGNGLHRHSAGVPPIHLQGRVQRCNSSTLVAVNLPEKATRMDIRDFYIATPNPS